MISTLESSVVTVSRISPALVYLIALDSRLRRMAVRASSSVSRVAGAFSLSTIRLTWLVSAIGRTRLRSRASRAGSSTSAGSMRSRPDSAFATSSRSLTRVSSVLPEFRMSWTW